MQTLKENHGLRIIDQSGEEGNWYLGYCTEGDFVFTAPDETYLVDAYNRHRTESGRKLHEQMMERHT